MEITIRDLVALIQELTEYTGEIQWDTSKPDGQPKRSLDVSRAQKEFGFTAKMPFREGLKRTIDWYEEHLGIVNKPVDSENHC
jgi:GDP-L-fucose synthase